MMATNEAGDDLCGDLSTSVNLGSNDQFLDPAAIVADPDRFDLTGETDVHDRFDPFLPSFEATVEECSLQQSMDINKESLKRKLLLRRSVAELADQGIYPPLKTPPAFAEQRKHLERAKAGDLLRKKLTHRPDRQCLVQHHILEDTNPRLEKCVQQRQRELKRSRLQENLSDHLVHRPGPLELVEANILRVEPEIHHAITEGKIQFPKQPFEAEGWFPAGDPHLWADLNDLDDLTSNWTLLGDSFESSVTQDSPNALRNAADTDILTTAPHNNNNIVTSPALTTSPNDISSCDYFTSSSAGSSSDQQFFPVYSGANVPSPPDIFPLLQGSRCATVSRIPTPPDITPLLQGTPLTPPDTTPLLQGAPLTVDTSTQLNNAPPPTTVNSVRPSTASSRGSISKKSKPKIGSKSKVIKFHQYLGPKNSHQSEPVTSTPTVDNTPFSVLVQQQQMLLQWQLEFQQRNVPFLLSMKSEPSPAPSIEHQPSVGVVATTTTIKHSPVGVVSSSVGGAKKSRSLDEMRVSDLREECRRFNLPKSGPKPALIERLLPHADVILGNTAVVETATLDGSKPVPSLGSPSDNNDVVPMDIDSSSQHSLVACKMEPCAPVSSDLPQSSVTAPQFHAAIPQCTSAFQKCPNSMQQGIGNSAIPQCTSAIPQASATNTIPQCTGGILPVVFMRNSAPSVNGIIPFGNTAAPAAMTSPNSAGVVMATVSSAVPPMVVFQPKLVPASATSISQEQSLLMKQQQQIAQLRQQLEQSQHELVLQQLMVANGGNIWTNGRVPAVNTAPPVAAAATGSAAGQLQRTSSVLNAVQCDSATPVRRCFTNPYINIHQAAPHPTTAQSSTNAVGGRCVVAPLNGVANDSSAIMDDVLDVLFRNSETPAGIAPVNNLVSMATTTSNRPSFFVPVADATVANSNNNAVIFDTNGFPGSNTNGDWFGCRQPEIPRLQPEVPGVDMMDMSSWIDDILPATPGNIDLFDLDSCDLCAPADGMRATFEKLMEVSTSKS